MGLSAFNAMRAREKAKQKAFESANVEVTETEPENIAEVAKVEEAETPAEEVEDKPKKTDAEKLKKKKE